MSWTGAARARSSGRWSDASRSTATTSTSSSACHHPQRQGATGVLTVRHRRQTAIGKIVEAVMAASLGKMPTTSVRRLISTKRMVGRVAASIIASASAMSFFWVFTYGLTNFGAISRTLWPKPVSVRAQWLAVAHASIATQHPECASMNARNCLRDCFFRKTTSPSAAAP